MVIPVYDIENLYVDMLVNIQMMPRIIAVINIVKITYAAQFNSTFHMLITIPCRKEVPL